MLEPKAGRHGCQPNDCCKAKVHQRTETQEETTVENRLIIEYLVCSRKLLPLWCSTSEVQRNMKRHIMHNKAEDDVILRVEEDREN